jgi:hypothetical protein
MVGSPNGNNVVNPYFTAYNNQADGIDTTGVVTDLTLIAVQSAFGAYVALIGAVSAPARQTAPLITQSDQAVALISTGSTPAQTVIDFPENECSR